MTTYDSIKSKLEKNPTARERKNKNRFIAWLIWKKYDLDNVEMNSDILENIIIDSSSYDRIWRQVLQECPELRGKDYDDKRILEQEKQIELGYGPIIKPKNV